MFTPLAVHSMQDVGGFFIFPMTVLSPSETVYLAFGRAESPDAHGYRSHILDKEGILYIVGKRNIIHKCKSRV